MLSPRTLSEEAWGRDRYAVLFVLLIGVYLILTIVDSRRWGGLARVFPVAITVLFAMHTSAARRPVLRLAQVAVLLSLAGGIAQAIEGQSGAAAGVSYLLVGLLLVLTPVAILRRVLPKKTVGIETIFAAVDVYIIIGLIYALVFQGLANLFHAPDFHAFLTQPANPTGSDYVYLSFVTLTTVGFGNVAPMSNLARSVVVLEALMGQIFLVTLVARLVSVYSADDRRSRLVRRRRGEDAEPGDHGTESDPPEEAPPAG